jgi:hypothetical protein
MRAALEQRHGEVKRAELGGERKSPRDNADAEV